MAVAVCEVGETVDLHCEGRLPPKQAGRSLMRSYLPTETYAAEGDFPVVPGPSKGAAAGGEEEGGARATVRQGKERNVGMGWRDTFSKHTSR